MVDAGVNDIDSFLRSPLYAPRWGWHDDHRHLDGTPDYRPAIQQVRGEFVEFLDLLRARGLCGSCLQLGMGECDASHEVWRHRFAHVVTIDRGRCKVDDALLQGLDTHDKTALALASVYGPYDLVFIDAGHSLEDVRNDHRDYMPLLRPRGIVAFHDALERPEYPEVGVPAYLSTLLNVHMIGSEVGIAWT